MSNKQWLSFTLFRFLVNVTLFMTQEVRLGCRNEQRNQGRRMDCEMSVNFPCLKNSAYSAQYECHASCWLECVFDIRRSQDQYSCWSLFHCFWNVFAASNLTSPARRIRDFFNPWLSPNYTHFNAGRDWIRMKRVFSRKPSFSQWKADQRSLSLSQSINHYFPPSKRSAGFKWVSLISCLE